MRKYIVRFLKQQHPSIILFEKEEKIVLHYYWRIWLSQEKEIYSIFVVYTPMFILNVDSSVKDKNLYSQLKSLIIQYPSLEEALLTIDNNVNKYDLFFLKSCTDFVEDVKQRGASLLFESCKLLDFCCVNSELCIFSVLYEIYGVTDYVILELGRKNYIVTYADNIVLSSFFKKLFKNIFDIEIISKRGETCEFIRNELP